MNVLIIPSWYPTTDNPINGIFFKEQAESIQSFLNRHVKGNCVVVLYQEYFSVRQLWKYFVAPKWELWQNEEVVTIHSKLLRLPKLHRLNIFRGGRNLKKLIKRAELLLDIKFDIVHIHSAIDAGLWYIMSGCQLPYVITEHSSKFASGDIDKVRSQIIPKVFLRSAKNIAVGKGLAEFIKNYSGSSPEIVFNIVKSPDSKKTFTKQSSQKNSFTFFSLGLKAKTKGFDVLVNAFGNYQKLGHEGALTIGGLDEKEFAYLNSIINEQEIKKVVLLPRLTKEQVFAYMHNCDCFVLTSRVETFGIVCAEAMYCGKPVIASRTGGPDSYINESNGIVVPVENVYETTKALLFMENNYSMFHSESIKQFAEANFSPDAISEKIVDIYYEVLGTNNTNDEND